MDTVVLWVLAAAVWALHVPMIRRMRRDPEVPVRRVWGAMGLPADGRSGRSVGAVGIGAGLVAVGALALAATAAPWLLWGWLASTVGETSLFKDSPLNVFAVATAVVPLALLGMPRIALSTEVFRMRARPERPFRFAAGTGLLKAGFMVACGLPIVWGLAMELGPELAKWLLLRRRSRPGQWTEDELMREPAYSATPAITWSVWRQDAERPLVAQAWSRLDPGDRTAAVAAAAVETAMALTVVAVVLGGAAVAALI